MNPTIWTDPILEEIRETREKMAEEAGYDMDKLVDMIKQSYREYQAERELFMVRENEE